MSAAMIRSVSLFVESAATEAAGDGFEAVISFVVGRVTGSALLALTEAPTASVSVAGADDEVCCQVSQLTAPTTTRRAAAHLSEAGVASFHKKKTRPLPMPAATPD